MGLGPEKLVCRQKPVDHFSAQPDERTSELYFGTPGGLADDDEPKLPSGDHGRWSDGLLFLKRTHRTLGAELPGSELDRVEPEVGCLHGEDGNSNTASISTVGTEEESLSF